MSRVLIVSNRLPVSIVRRDGEIQLQRSAGGLATGLAGVHAKAQGIWVGWPGDAGDLRPEELQALADRWKAWRLAPVPLSAQEVEGYYEQFCNGVLWPALHYLISHLPYRSGLRPVRGGEPPFRRRGGRALPARGHDLGPRLSADAGAPDDPRATARRAHRLLPAHPFSGVGRVPHLALPGGDADRGCWARTWSAFTRRRTCAISPRRRCAPWAWPATWIACAGRGATCASACSRWAWTRRELPIALARTPRSRSGPGRAIATTSPRAPGSWWASIGSTTPRGYPGVCWPSRPAARAPRAAREGPADSRWRFRRAPRSSDTRSSGAWWTR